MFRRNDMELVGLPGRVAMNAESRGTVRLSVAARGFFASRGVEAQPWHPEPARDPVTRCRPSTPTLRAYAQGEGVGGIGERGCEQIKAPERGYGKKQRGIATVEFAIAVPVILLLLCAAAEAGKWLYEYNTLHKAVRDGVRYLAGVAIRGTTGIVDPSGDEGWSEKEAATQCLVVYGTSGLEDDGTCTGTDPVLPNLETTDITVPDSDDGIHVQVDASYDYDPIFDIGIPTFGFGDGPIDFDPPITASATMRAL